MLKGLSLLAATEIRAAIGRKLAAIVFAIGAYRKSQPVERSPLASTALVAAPVAAQTLGRRVNLGTIGLIAVIVSGALIGRRLARD